jgi:hypothetical protein
METGIPQIEVVAVEKRIFDLPESARRYID